jgi:hypothetical protein
MRVLVCGGRDFDDYKYLSTVLTAIQATHDLFTVLIHGDAKGADAHADAYARLHLIPVLRFPADWKRLGTAAGPARNAKMLRDGKPDMVIAFKGGRGTANMVKQATEAGVTVFDARS